MAKPEILNEQPITMAELNKELNAIKKRDKELSFRTTKAEEYLQHFKPLDIKKADELKEKLEKLKITRLKPEMIIKIIDILPGTVDELKVILQEFVVSVSSADMKKIIEVVKEFVPEK